MVYFLIVTQTKPNLYVEYRRVHYKLLRNVLRLQFSDIQTQTDDPSLHSLLRQLHFGGHRFVVEAGEEILHGDSSHAYSALPCRAPDVWYNDASKAWCLSALIEILQRSD